MLLPRTLRSVLPVTAVCLLVACGTDAPVDTRPAGASRSAEAPASASPIPEPPVAAGALAPRLVSAPSGLLLSWLEPLTPEENPTAALAHDAAPPSPGHRLRFSRLRNEAWSEPVTLAEGKDFFANWADFPSVTESEGGVMLAHWLENNGEGPYAYGVRVARSSNGGASWEPLGWLHTDRSATEHGFVSLAPLAGSDTFAAVWLDGREMPGGGAMTLRAATVGQEVTDARLLDDRVCDCCATAAVATADGVLVAYRDRTEEEVRDISVARYPADGDTATTSVHDDGWVIAGCPVNGPAVTAAGDRVVVAWFTAAAGNPHVRAAFSDDGGRTFGPPAEIAAKGSLGRVGVAWLEGESPEAVVSWLGEDDTGDGAAVWLRRVDAAGDAGEPWKLTATSAGRRSGFPQLVAHDGSLYAAWVETRRDGEDEEVPGRIHVRRVDPRAIP